MLLFLCVCVSIYIADSERKTNTNSGLRPQRTANKNSLSKNTQANKKIPVVPIAQESTEHLPTKDKSFILVCRKRIGEKPFRPCLHTHTHIYNVDSTFPLFICRQRTDELAKKDVNRRLMAR